MAKPEAGVLLRLQDVGVCYRKELRMFNAERHQALSGLTFDLLAGETLGVLGRNGAGKSTLMKLLANIIAPDQGSIERRVKRVQLLSLQVGFMPHLTGRQNVIMAGILLGMRRREIIARMDRVVEFSELGDKIDEPIRNYSSGMLARLGFAISIQSDPDVLLIDEVLGVGDASFKPKAKRVIQERIQSSAYNSPQSPTSGFQVVSWPGAKTGVCGALCGSSVGRERCRPRISG